MQIDNKDLLTLVKSFARANPLPLDKDEIKGSIAEAEAYLKSPIAYPGQTIKVLDEDGSYKMYIIQKKEDSEDFYLEEPKVAVDESTLTQYIQVSDSFPLEPQPEVLYILTQDYSGYIWNEEQGFIQIFGDVNNADLSAYARLDGASFKGSVLLAADPIVDKEAATKHYVDELEETIENSYKKIKYEISSKPAKAIIDYREKEIRVFCPVDTEWTEQNVGPTGNANMYYMGFKAYAPENAVSFKEGDRGVIIDEMFTFDDDFAGIDEYGRKYSICWLALASKNSAGEWTYYGKNSSVEKYIGWDYVVEWYDENGIIISSDKIRINLSNESCHSQIAPSYVFKMKGEAIEEAKAYTDNALTWGSF